MFFYPALYSAGFFDMTLKVFGIYVGGTAHEVAVGNAAPALPTTPSSSRWPVS